MSKTDLQEMYVEYLRQEGYLPSIDDDGDILFRASGSNYYIIIYEDDPQFFQILLQLNLGSISLETALNAANYASRRSKVAKVFISESGRYASITAELIFYKPEDFKPIFSRALRLISNARENFESQL